MSSVNDHYLITGDTSILNLKNTYNQLVNTLQFSSLDNLLINPTLSHIPVANSVPFSWNISGSGVTFSDSGSYKTIEFSAVNQYVYQNVFPSLQLNSEYTAVFDVEYDGNETTGIELSIEVSNNLVINPSIIWLNPSTNKISLVKNILNNGKERRYIHFKTTDVSPSNVLFQIKNTKAGSNSIIVKNFAVVKGAIELFNFTNIPDFLSNVRYNTDLYQWEITHDGINWGKLIAIDSDTNVATIEPVYPLIDMIALDSTYNITYPLIADNNFVKADTTTPYILKQLYAANWNDSTTYATDELVYYNNLTWRSLGVIEGQANVGKVPTGYSKHWVLTYNKSKQTLDFDLLTYQKAFYSQHIQTEDGNNGKHSIPDLITGLKYDIAPVSSTFELVLNSTSTSNTNASFLYNSFNVGHSKEGEHVFSGKKLVLTYTTGTPVLTQGALTKTVFTEDDLVNFDTTFVKTTPSTINLYHDINGNHIIEDTENLPYILTANGTSFNYTPITNNLTSLQTTFAKFRIEHDKYGRHVFRDDTTGKFYRITTTDGSTLAMEECIFEPANDISQFLELYNAEHDINGDHVIPYDGDYYKINTTGNAGLSLVTKVNLYHQDKIIGNNKIFGTLHTTGTSYYQHTFKINNGAFVSV